jgi:hypothetical protein
VNCACINVSHGRRRRIHAQNRAHDGHGPPWAHRGLDPAAGLAADAGLTLTADTATLGPHRTGVVLGGTYTCGPFTSGRPDRGVIDLSVQQDLAGSTVTAFGFLEPAVCDGTSQRFEVTLTGTGGKRFRQGAATWSASGYVEGDTGLQHVQVPPTPIVLTR